MKITYEQQTGSSYIYVDNDALDKKVYRTEITLPGFMHIDFNLNNEVIGIELLGQNEPELEIN